MLQLRNCFLLAHNARSVAQPNAAHACYHQQPKHSTSHNISTANSIFHHRELKFEADEQMGSYIYKSCFGPQHPLCKLQLYQTQKCLWVDLTAYFRKYLYICLSLELYN